MKKIIFSIVLYSVTGFMEVQSAELAICSDYLEVTDIKPFGAPFTQVPRIVFANPPHRILKLTNESCATIRKAAQTVTHEQIRSLVLKQTAAQSLSRNAVLVKHLEAAESYDWIIAMEFINDHLHDRTVDVEFVKEINLRLGRLTEDNSGEFRRDGEQWELCQLTSTEKIFSHYINRTPGYLHFFQELGASKSHSKIFCQSCAGILNNEDRYLRFVENRYVSTQTITELFAAMIQAIPSLLDLETGQPYRIDIHAAEAWELEERETNPSYRAGYIDANYWFDKRMYAFCGPEEVEKLLTEAIRVNSRSSLHPIEQAAQIWLSIIRINPFIDANKRTAKAIATFILLKHGYLPPLLTSDDVAKCTKILKDNLDPRRGYHYFTQYIAGLVKRAQDQYAGQIV